MQWLCEVQTNMATSSSDSFEITKNTKGKANVWAHFGFVKESDDDIDKTRVPCKICRLVLKYSDNTTNLNDHIRRRHASAMSTTSSAAVPVAQHIQPSKHGISAFFAAKLPRSSNRAKAISGAILQFIVKDMRPFSAVANSGFKNLLAILEPRYTIPSRQHFSDKALPELYEQQKSEVKRELGEAVQLQ